MPIKIPDNLPAHAVLEQENIPLITQSDALRQDIRPLQIGLLNLMPDKIKTETQILRALGGTPLQVDVTLLRTASYVGTNTPEEHLQAFYQTLDNIEGRYFDALIITGAPVEHLDFEDVDYWQELQKIMTWAQSHVFSTMFICWGAQAGLYHYYGVNKKAKEQKIFGVFPHKKTANSRLLSGFDDQFHVPVSRYTLVTKEEIDKVKDLQILAISEQDDLCLVQDAKRRRVFMFNHLEYDLETLGLEYKRDQNAGKDTDVPANYYPDNNPQLQPEMNWRAHRTLLFHNWINLIYQGTPYDMEDIPNYATHGWDGMRSGKTS